MRRPGSWMIIAALALVLAALLVFWLLRKGGKADAEAEPTPSALVTVAAVRSQAVEDLTPVYGVVQPAASGLLTVASPKAAIVVGVFVGPGQTVAKGQPLVQLANAPASDLAYRQAADAQAFAAKDLARVQRLAAEHLAANDQLSAAQKALADAQAVLAAQQKQGSGQPNQLVVSPFAGVVTAVTAVAGDRVAQDASLLVVAHGDALSAKLSLQPDDAPRAAAGQTVLLKPVFGGAPIQSRLALVGRQLDPATRTVDAVAPLQGAALPIGASLEGQIVTGRHQGLVIPRAAVVFDETGSHVFTVAGGKAHRVFVRVGKDQGPDVEVQSGLSAGAEVAVEGAYELQDGMDVRTRR